MSAITIDNDLVHYEVLGRGRPVILLHGWLSSWRYWIPTMQQLSMKYRTYALDLWGYGDSGKDPNRLSLDGHVELLGNFMDKLGITKTAFVGHSLGSAVMVRYALRYPDRVARIMAISAPVFEADRGTPPAAPPPLAPPAPPRPAASQAQTILRPGLADPEAGETRPVEATRVAPPDNYRPTVLHREGDPANATAGNPTPRPATQAKQSAPLPPRPSHQIPNPLRTRLMGIVPRDLVERHLNKEMADYDKLVNEASKTAPTAFEASTRSFDQIDLAYDLRYVRVPMVLIHGDEDQFVVPPSPGLINYLTFGRNDFRCVLWPGTSHFPMLEDPTAFHRLVADFLEARDIDDLEFKERWIRKVR
jgi:pimeloyl-ACP methyl ester carboxylesterase